MIVPHLAMAADSIEIPTEQQKALGVEIKPVETAHTEMGLEATAKVIIPSTSIRVIGAPSDGLITGLVHQTGDSVRKGDSLGRFSSPALVEARKQLVQAQLKHRLAQDNAKRDERLANQGLLARNTFLNTQNEVDLSRADIDAAEKTIRLLGAQPEDESSEIRLSAPISGTILETLVETGQQVDISTPLVKIADLHSLALEIPLTVEQAQDVESGDKITLIDNTLTGNVRSIQPSADNAQNILVRADIEQNDVTLHAGQTVKIKVIKGTDATNTLSIPSSALIWVSEKPYVFIQNEKGFKATPTHVKTQNGEIAFVTNIPTDSKVAFKGVAALKAKWQESGE